MYAKSLKFALLGMFGVKVGGRMKPGMSKRGTFGGSLEPPQFWLFKFKAARKWFSSTLASVLGGELTLVRLFMLK